MENNKAHIKSIVVKNAGLVLLNSYIKMLFDRLKLTDGKTFTSTEAQLKAILYLQFLATGMTNTQEPMLAINKILCGVPLTTPINSEFEIAEADTQLVNDLITAAISHWPSIGNCSINGFRGNWLLRDGILVELEEKWEVTVERKAYDILIARSPFSFSVIKYPWMDKPLYVNWP